MFLKKIKFFIFNRHFIYVWWLFQGNSGGATSEVAKAKQAICERGQKLNEIEDRTEMMSNEAKVNNFIQSVILIASPSFRSIDFKSCIFLITSIRLLSLTYLALF